MVELPIRCRGRCVMKRLFGLGRAHEVLIRDLGRLERCNLVLMIVLGEQTQAKVKKSQTNAKSKQQQKRVDTVVLRGAVRKQRKKEEKEASKIDVDI